MINASLVLLPDIMFVIWILMSRALCRFIAEECNKDDNVVYFRAGEYLPFEII